MGIQVPKNAKQDLESPTQQLKILPSTHKKLKVYAAAARVPIYEYIDQLVKEKETLLRAAYAAKSS